jgi:hypothetical protein
VNDDRLVESIALLHQGLEVGEIFVHRGRGLKIQYFRIDLDTVAAGIRPIDLIVGKNRNSVQARTRVRVVKSVIRAAPIIPPLAVTQTPRIHSPREILVTNIPWRAGGEPSHLRSGIAILIAQHEGALQASRNRPTHSDSSIWKENQCQVNEGNKKEGCRRELVSI